MAAGACENDTPDAQAKPLIDLQADDLISGSRRCSHRQPGRWSRALRVPRVDRRRCTGMRGRPSAERPARSPPHPAAPMERLPPPSAGRRARLPPCCGIERREQDGMTPAVAAVRAAWRWRQQPQLKSEHREGSGWGG
jgi:hypothetical protein